MPYIVLHHCCCSHRDSLVTYSYTCALCLFYLRSTRWVPIYIRRGLHLLGGSVLSLVYMLQALIILINPVTSTLYGREGCGPLTPSALVVSRTPTQAWAAKIRYNRATSFPRQHDKVGWHIFFLTRSAK